jgi:hypothetical protein
MKTNFILMEMRSDFPRWQFPYFSSRRRTCAYTYVLKAFWRICYFLQVDPKNYESRFSVSFLRFLSMCVHVTNEIILTYLRDWGRENVKSWTHQIPTKKHNNQAHNNNIWILENYAIEEIRKVFSRLFLLLVDFSHSHVCFHILQFPSVEFPQL